MDLDRFTRKLGPLPVWAWGLIAVGAAYVLYKLTTHGTSTPSSTTDTTETDTKDSNTTTTPGTSGGDSYAPDVNPPSIQTLGPSSGGYAPDPYYNLDYNPYPVAAIPNYTSDWWNPFPVDDIPTTIPIGYASQAADNAVNNQAPYSNADIEAMIARTVAATRAGQQVSARKPITPNPAKTRTPARTSTTATHAPARNAPVAKPAKKPSRFAGAKATGTAKVLTPAQSRAAQKKQQAAAAAQRVANAKAARLSDARNRGARR